ncbi:MAG TPA: MFS transporter [Polyangia bacterium]|nr:MFS transporter [Polyangia bacterium]
MTDGRRLLITRAIRGLADGVVSVALASYLTDLGFSAFEVGVLVAGTLLGSAAVTLGVGLFGYRLSRRRILLGACALMALTGIGFAGLTTFWPLFVVGVAGTLNPSAGDVSLFLPTEQAVLAQTAAGTARTRAFAWYNLTGSLAGALGALISGVPALIAARRGVALLDAERGVFVFYVICAIVAAIVYRTLSPAVEVHAAEQTTRPLAQSRAVVLRLAALFSLDSFGGGFVVQSLLVLWLYRRFHLDEQTTATVFFAAGVLSAFSQILSPVVAARIGLIRTMVYTHLPANIFLVLAAFMPSTGWTITCLLLRMAVSQMDVPARQAFVMAVVPPEERTAASSVTNVPRSLAAGLAPVIAGALLERTNFGWPLVIGGALKAIYDVVLLFQFRAVVPREEGVR